MNFLNGLSAGFIYPFALLSAVPAVLLLVYIYRRRGTGPRVTVSSTILLKLLRTESPARQKFVPPFRFFFELLLILLLVLALAGFFLAEPESRELIIIDNSFSMFQKSGASGRRLYDDLQERAGEHIKYGRHAEYNIYITSPSFKSATSGWVSREKALRVLADQNPEYGSDNLQAALDKLQASRDFDYLTVFTDRSPEKDREDDIVRVVNLARYSGRHGNLFIKDISVTEDKVGEQIIRVKLGAYTDKEVQVEVSLYGLDLEGVEQAISSKKVQLSSEGKTVEFSVGGSQALAFRADLKAIQSAAWQDDSIEEDDHAWISMESRGSKVLVVSPFSPEELGLSRIKRFAFRYLTPEEYSKEQIAEDPVQAVVFHRFVPEKLPDINSFIVFPEEESDEIRFAGEETASSFSDWRQEGELLRYIDMPSLSLKSGRIMEVPVWGENLISSSEGTLMWAGQVQGVRKVVTGFELFPYEGRQSPAVTVLTLNVFKWLMASDFRQGYREVKSLNKDNELRVIDTYNNRYLEEQPGAYLSETGRVAVFDYFDVAESDTFNQEDLKLNHWTSERKERSGSRGRGAELALLALIFLLGDLIFQIIRIKKRQRQI